MCNGLSFKKTHTFRNLEYKNYCSYKGEIHTPYKMKKMKMILQELKMIILECSFKYFIIQVANLNVYYREENVKLKKLHM